MTTPYITTVEFTERLIGALTKDLPVGVLANYILDGSEYVDEVANWTFAPTTQTEKLLTTSMRQAVIDANGWASLYPVLARPIQTVTSLSYQIRTPGDQGTPTVIDLDPSHYLVDNDASGEGWRVVVYEDFSAYRSRRSLLQFNLGYTAGYTATAQVETSTVAGAATGNGTLAVVVTAAGMSNSPKTVNVAVTSGETAAAIAAAIVVALNADADVGPFFTASATGAAVSITAVVAGRNDRTMNLAWLTAAGIPAVPTSTHTTAGASTYPQWLKVATIHATALQLKSRQEVQVIQTEEGAAAVDLSAMGGHKARVDFFLRDHKRLI